MKSVGERVAQLLIAPGGKRGSDKTCVCQVFDHCFTGEGFWHDSSRFARLHFKVRNKQDKFQNRIDFEPGDLVPSLGDDRKTSVKCGCRVIRVSLQDRAKLAQISLCQTIVRERVQRKQYSRSNGDAAAQAASLRYVSFNKASDSKSLFTRLIKE